MASIERFHRILLHFVHRTDNNSTMTSDKENIVIGSQPAAVKASKAIVASVVQVEAEVAAERARRLHFNQLVRTARHWERCHHFDEVGSA
jgi:hypothetical protein